MSDKELMQQALDALIVYDGTNGESKRKRVLAALRERLAQPEQEPVAWMCSDASLISKGYSRFSRTCAGEWNIPVYTAPRQWQGLTDDEAVDLLPYGDWEIESTLKFARAIEAKLKEKNNA